MLPLIMLEVRYYLSGDKSPFADRLGDLDVTARTKVTVAIARLQLGNLSNVKSVGEGVLPGYRVYFGRDGDTLVILLCGGTKKRQQRDIAQAIACWHHYKKSKTTR
jgi:putative addiction module killer protein